METDSQRVKLILTYDIIAETQDRYYQYMLGEMVPAAQGLGLAMAGAWHTAYGDYPIRLVEFIADNYDSLMTVLNSPQWERLETHLQRFVSNYARKVVRLRDDQFQF